MKNLFKKLVFILSTVITILSFSACATIDYTSNNTSNNTSQNEIRENEINIIKEYLLVGDGSEVNPFIISNFNDLQTVSTLVKDGITFANIYLKMNKDIDCSRKTWIPIGYEYDTYFQGVFDGNNFSIKNINVDKCEYVTYSGESKSTAIHHLGVFGQTKNAVVKNLEVYNFDISPSIYTIGYDFTNFRVGGIVGLARNTLIENCKLTDLTIEMEMDFYEIIDVGGIVGQSWRNTISQTSVDANINVRADGLECGGFVGSSCGDTINNSYMNGSIKAHTCGLGWGCIVGGFIGEMIDGKETHNIQENTEYHYFETNIQNCYSSAIIKATAYYYDPRNTAFCSVGGFIGQVGDEWNITTSTMQKYDLGIMTECFATGDISVSTDNYYVGGFAGRSRVQIPINNFITKEQKILRMGQYPMVGNNLGYYIHQSELLAHIEKIWDKEIWQISAVALPKLY